jgi:acyl carrier protein
MEKRMKQVNEQQIQADLIEILSKLTDVNAAQIKGTDRLREDLGLDSLQSMELLSRISDKYELDLEVEDVMDVQTVADVVSELHQFMETGKKE